MGGLEPPDELVEGVHHLLCEALAHLVLVLATVLEEGGEPLGARQREEALLGEEEAEGGAEGAPGGETHVCDTEVHPARALPPRGGNEAKRDAVEEQAGGDPGAPEQALGAALGRGFEARTGAAGYRRVEVLSGVEHLDEKLPGRLPVPRVALADGEVGAQGLAVVREGNLQLGRNGSLLGAGVPAGREAPVENGGGELAEIGDAGLRAARGVERALANAAKQPALPFRVLPVQDRSRLRERRGGDHQAVRLDVAEPFEVGARVGVGEGHVAVAGLSVLRRAAEIPHAEQLLVRLPEVLAVSGGKDSPAWGGNDVPVPEIVHQQVVVREEQTCPACDGERQDVFVIGSALIFLLQASLYGCNSSAAYLQDQPRLDIARIHSRNLPLAVSSSRRSPPTASEPWRLSSQFRNPLPASVCLSPNTSNATSLSTTPHISSRWSD